MGQVTIYLEEDIEQKMVHAAKFAKLSKSKWIAKLIHDKVANEWPQSVVELAGSWDDFPTIDDIREIGEKNSDREDL